MAFNWKPPPKHNMRRPKGSMECRQCGGTDMVESETSGDRACARCGVVQQENSIVSTVQFSESGGSSNVVGQFVSGDKGRPSGGGAGRGRSRFGHSQDSRESTIQNGKKKIIQVLAQLHLKTTLAEAVTRLFGLCVNQNYVQGRKTMNIVAACVYIVCRQKHFPIMLIDISDKLAVNVYVLGKTFQKLIKFLNLQTEVPIVDPAMYIKRFAAKLDLGSKTNAVCLTALKIIGSMKRDFLASGRQPAGVCCAALTLATRVNRIERSKEEIRKAVKVCDATVRKRLLEFEATPTSQLTVEELNKLPQTVSFPGVDQAAATTAAGGGELGSAANNGAGASQGKDGAATSAGVAVLVSEVRMDPPAFIANRIRDGRLTMPWTKQMLPESTGKGLKGGRGSKKVKATSTRAGKAAAAATTAKGGVRPRVGGSRKHGSKDRRGGTSSTRKLSPPERRGAAKEDVNSESSDEGEKEEKAGTAPRRRVLPRRKSAAAAAKKMSTDDDNDDDPNEEGGGGDDDDDSAYSSSGGEEDGEDEQEEEEEEEEEDQEEGEDGSDGSEYADKAAVSARKRRAKGKGKGKGRAAARSRKRRKKTSLVRSEDEDEENEDDDQEDEEGKEEQDEEDEEDEEEEDDRLSSKMKVDANTKEGREALTRHVLHIRGVQNGAGKAKGPSKRSKVQTEVYSCLESMFDEDEERGLSVGRGGSAGGGGGSSSSSGQSNATTAGVKADGGDEDGTADADADAAAATAAASAVNKKTELSESASSKAALENEGGGSGGGSGDGGGAGAGADAGAKDDGDGGAQEEEEEEEEVDLEWGVYLRSEEDSDRTKKEWEKEHKEWMEDQADKQRILAEEEGSDSPSAVAKRKRKYNLSASKSSGGTFADVIQTEAAKNKSLKIDHAALQRVMNLDGSLKQVDEDDDAMEEVFEDNLAPPAPSKNGKRHGGGERGKLPLTANASSSASASTPAKLRPFTGAAVLPPARRSNASSGEKGKGNLLPVKQQQPAAVAAVAKAAKAATVVKAPAVVKAPWAPAGPDDGGEQAIKDALALLTMGGLAALPDTSTVSPAAAGPGAGAGSLIGATSDAATVPAVRVTPAMATTPQAAATVAADIVEEPEGQEEEHEDDGKAVGGAAAVAAATVEEEEEEDDDDDDDDDDAIYGEMDDDDDPYGEEA